MAKKTRLQKISMKFSTSQLDRIILALITYPGNKKFSGNVERLFEMFSEDTFKNEYEKEVRVFIIKKMTAAIGEIYFNSGPDLLNYIDLTGKYEEEAGSTLNQLKDQEVDESELELLDKQISLQLRMSIIENSAKTITDLSTQLVTDSYEDSEKFLDDFENATNILSRNLKSAQESLKDSKYDVSLGNDGFLNSLRTIIDEDRNPAVKIKTGIQMINDMFEGGWERGRFYVALGLAKGWKSSFLLNAALWALKYNKLTSQDPKMKPVVVYLTQENSVKETIKRIWGYAFGNDSVISDYEPGVAARMLEEAGIFTPNQPNKPELVIWYRSSKSISTADLNNMLDELNKEGKECVFLIQDYLKRIRPTVPEKEVRLELARVSDEFASMAKERNIPILSAMQLKIMVELVEKQVKNSLNCGKPLRAQTTNVTI